MAITPTKWPLPPSQAHWVAPYGIAHCTATPTPPRAPRHSSSKLTGSRERTCQTHQDDGVGVTQCLSRGSRARANARNARVITRSVGADTKNADDFEERAGFAPTVRSRTWRATRKAERPSPGAAKARSSVNRSAVPIIRAGDRHRAEQEPEEVTL